MKEKKSTDTGIQMVLEGESVQDNFKDFELDDQFRDQDRRCRKDDFFTRSNNFIDSYMLVFELFWRFWGRVGHD